MKMNDLDITLSDSKKPKKSNLENELIKQYEDEQLSEEELDALIVSFIEMDMNYFEML